MEINNKKFEIQSDHLKSSITVTGKGRRFHLLDDKKKSYSFIFNVVLEAVLNDTDLNKKQKAEILETLISLKNEGYPLKGIKKYGVEFRRLWGKRKQNNLIKKAQIFIDQYSKNQASSTETESFKQSTSLLDKSSIPLFSALTESEKDQLMEEWEIIEATPESDISIETVKDLAKKGSLNAQLKLGTMLLKNREDEDEAMAWLNLVIERTKTRKDEAFSIICQYYSKGIHEKNLFDSEAIHKRKNFKKYANLRLQFLNENQEANQTEIKNLKEHILMTQPFYTSHGINSQAMTIEEYVSYLRSNTNDQKKIDALEKGLQAAYGEIPLTKEIAQDYNGLLV